jgi:hypothetical protein
MKREPVGNEREQDTWLGNTLRRSPATAPAPCLDAETLAAYADGGLSTKAATAVELHASNCSRCTEVLAAMERTAPAATVAEAWTLARVFRWVAPFAAAATAVTIWIVVPQRSTVPVETTISQDLQVPAPVPGSGSGAGSGFPVAVPGSRADSSTANQTAAPRTGNAELREQTQLRDESRRERVEPQALGSVAAPAPGAPNAPSALGAPNAPNAPVAPAPIAPSAPFAPEPSAEALARADAPQAAASAPAPAPAPPAQKFAADAVTESATAATSQRSAMSLAAKPSESISPSNPLMRWRVTQPVAVERSRDGGKTWTKTTSPAPNVVIVRAVDGDRAVATTSDNAQFYTTNAGRSWTRVQENSAAPF